MFSIIDKSVVLNKTGHFMVNVNDNSFKINKGKTFVKRLCDTDEIYFNEKSCMIFILLLIYNEKD